MDDQSHTAASGKTRPRFFYGWYIVAVGILVNIAGTFAFSSTLSIFLKPITEELGVSRGAFSLIRTFEIGVAALIVPMLGSWIDRHGGRGVLVLGVLMEGAGLLLSSLVQGFWQFVVVRCSLVIAGEALLGVMCPLTVWEDMLRGGVRPESFVGRWVRYLLYYQAPEWVFTVAYVAWTLATLVTLRLVPPRISRAAPS